MKDLHVQFMTFCDYSMTSQEGKLSIVGIFDEVRRLMMIDGLVEKVNGLKFDQDKIQILEPFFHWTPPFSIRHGVCFSSLYTIRCDQCDKSYMRRK